MAAVTDEGNRPLAFSLNCSIGTALGIAGGLAGGHLPNLLQHLNPAGGTLEAKRLGVLAGAGIIALAAVAASRLRFPRVSAPSESKTYPRSRFIVGFPPPC